VPALRRAEVDAEHRGREKPSDHAPVWIELDEDVLGASDQRGS
jgi:exodeoxyribonuclease-3